MVVTIEPGLYEHRHWNFGFHGVSSIMHFYCFRYLPFDDLDVPDQYRGIGIRIEDDILITDGDPVNLTSVCNMMSVTG